MSAVDGPTLRSVREGLGVTLRHVARQARCSHGHLSKVERGEHGRPITPAILQAYEKATGVSLDALLKDRPEHAPVELVSHRRGAWRAGQLTDARRVAYSAGLAALAAGGQLGEPVGRLVDSAGKPAAPERPDAAEVTQLRETANLLTTLDLRHGGGFVSQLAKVVLRWAVGMLRSPFEPDDPSLAAAIGTVAGRAAWAAFDCGLHEQARTLFRLAVYAAVRARDPDLRAHLLADAAAQHHALGHPEDCLELLRIAGGDERVGPAVRMTLHGVRARAYATLGEQDACRRQITLAEQSHAESLERPAGGWAGLIATAGHLYAVTGHAAAGLGSADAGAGAGWAAEAVERLDRAAAALAASGSQRAAALCLCRLAVLHVHGRSYEEAVRWAKLAADAAVGVHSQRVVQALADVRAAAAAGPDQPALRQIAGLAAAGGPESTAANEESEAADCRPE